MAKYIVFFMIILIIIASFLLIKQCNKNSIMGQELYKTKLTKGQKWVLSVAILFIISMSVLAVFQVKEDFSGTGTVIYWWIYLLPLLTINQVFVIRECGIGQQNIISSGKYGLIEWNKVKGYRWDYNKLTVMYTSNNKLTTREFKVKIDDKSIIDDIINKKIEQGDS